MRVGGLAPPLFAAPSRAGPAPALTSFQRMSQYRLSSRRLEDLRRTVLEAREILAQGPTGLRSAGSSVRLTGAALGLDLVGVRSTLTSSEQVNAATTSIGDRTPDWNGGSNAAIVLDGTWTGTVDDTLTFIPDRDRTIPTNKGVKIDVFDGAGQEIDSIQVGQNYTPGTPVALSNGLTMTVGAGFLEDGDEATITLSATVGSALVRTARFDGTGDGDAVLEDPHVIADGSFTINGTPVAVNASDTLDDLLDRINMAGLGLTAAYDEVTEQVTLTADDVGPSAITLANDNSGILAALKLAGTPVQVGRDPDDIRALETVSAFSAVTDGTITINGVDVDVDVSQDSLQDVVAALDALDGVNAVFEGGRVVVTGSAGVSLEVSDTSGLLGVLDIAVGSHEASRRVRGLSTPRAIKLAGVLHELAGTIDALLADQLPGPSAATGITRLRGGLATIFTTVFEAEGNQVTGLGGLTFEFSDDRTRGVRGSSSAERRLAKLLDDGDEDTLAVLLGDRGDEPGLLKRLDDFTRDNLAGIRDTLRVGQRVDVLA